MQAQKPGRSPRAVAPESVVRAALGLPEPVGPGQLEAAVRVGPAEPGQPAEQAEPGQPAEQAGAGAMQEPRESQELLVLPVVRAADRIALELLVA